MSIFIDHGTGVDEATVGDRLQGGKADVAAVRTTIRVEDLDNRDMPPSVSPTASLAHGYRPAGPFEHVSTSFYPTVCGT